MADKKEFTLKVNGLEQSIENVDRLVDNMLGFEQQTIKAISAQEVLQSVIEAQDPKKGIEKIIPVYQKLNNIQEHLLQMTPIGIKAQQEAYEIVAKGIKTQIEGSKTIDKLNKEKLDDLKKLEQKEMKRVEKLEQYKITSLERIEKIEKNKNIYLSDDRKVREEFIDAEEKKIKESTEKIATQREEVLKKNLQTMQDEADDFYTRQIRSIEYKYSLEEAQIRKSADLTFTAEAEKIAYKKGAAADEEGLRNTLYTKLKDLDERRTAELNKAEQEHQKAQSTIIDNIIKERSANLEVEIDTTYKKLEKKTKKIVKEVKDLFDGIDQETQKSIIAESVKMQKAAKDATDAVKKEAAAMKEATTAKTESATASKTETAATKEATAATKEATDATKKYIDINATRTNLKSRQEEMKIMQKLLREQYDEQIAEYDKEIAAAGDNAEKRKEIEDKKKEYTRQYGVDIIKLGQGINSAKKKEQDLGILQWKQYAQKAEEIAGSIKGVTDQISGALGSAFTAVSKAYDAEIASWDEKIKHLKNKNVEVSKEIENQGKKVAALEAAQKNASAAGLEKRAEELATSLKAEKEIYQEQLKNKEELEKKEREYERRKAKEQAKKEKIEKLNRKATLIKNIGEATVNVAQGITKTLGAYPWPLNLALATIVGAAGAVQIGIMTKQLAKFQDGGLLHGKRHSQGGMRIEGTNMEVEGGEFVVNRVSTDKNLGLVKYINQQRRKLKPKDLDAFFARSSQSLEPSFKRMFAQGGQLPTIEPATNVDNDSLIKAIQEIKIEPKVAVTDIHRAQDNMVSVSGWSGV